MLQVSDCGLEEALRVEESPAGNLCVLFALTVLHSEDRTLKARFWGRAFFSFVIGKEGVVA